MRLVLMAAALAALAIVAAAAATASASTGCTNEQSTMQVAHTTRAVDTAQVKIDQLIVSLREQLLAGDRRAGDASAVRVDQKKLTGARRKLAAAISQAGIDNGQLQRSRARFARCMRGRQS
jgi:hypothetical protein